MCVCVCVCVCDVTLSLDRASAAKWRVSDGGRTQHRTYHTTGVVLWASDRKTRASKTAVANGEGVGNRGDRGEEGKTTSHACPLVQPRCPRSKKRGRVTPVGVLLRKGSRASPAYPTVTIALVFKHQRLHLIKS